MNQRARLSAMGSDASGTHGGGPGDLQWVAMNLSRRAARLVRQVYDEHGPDDDLRSLWRCGDALGGQDLLTGPRVPSCTAGDVLVATTPMLKPDKPPRYRGRPEFGEILKNAHNH